MLIRFLFALIFAIPVLANAQVSVLVPDCEIDEEMAANLKSADIIVKSSSKVLDPTDIKSQACIPVLEDIGGMIGSSVPSFSFSGNLIDKIRDAACEAANSALEKMVRRARVTYDAPYGLGEVDAGLNTNGEWSAPQPKDNGKEWLDPMEKEAIKLGTQAGKQSVESVKGATKPITNINRDLKSDTNERNNDWDEEVDETLDNL